MSTLDKVFDGSFDLKENAEERMMYNRQVMEDNVRQLRDFYNDCGPEVKLRKAIGRRVDLWAIRQKEMQ